jgi:hypothetical protein
MRNGLTVMVLALLVGVLAGCGGKPAAAPPKLHQEASKVAVEFYHAYFLSQDYAKAWDLALPSVHNKGRTKPYSDRTEFVQFWTERSKPLANRAYEIEEHKRVDAFVYLVSDSQTRHLIWVERVDGVWKVSNWDFYDGGEVSW